MCFSLAAVRAFLKAKRERGEKEPGATVRDRGTNAHHPPTATRRALNAALFLLWAEPSSVFLAFGRKGKCVGSSVSCQGNVTTLRGEHLVVS